MTEYKNKLDRRNFMYAATGALTGAVLSVTGNGAAQAQKQRVDRDSTTPRKMPPRDNRLFRLEADVADCEVTGEVPSELNGAFYRVGPDPQYPLHHGNIPFDGEGHVSMFRIKDGRVDFRSRYIRNERYQAQDKARKILFPMYRNPYLDDPSVKGISRSTANTHIINHKNMLLCLKEDSPPTAVDLTTLETLIPSYTFDGRLESKTFTAHPKVDSETGDLLAFGYEARGFGTNDINVFQISPEGEMKWNAWVKCPYVCMIHDFAVTQRHVLFYAIPLAFDDQQMKNGGIHWSWQKEKPTYLGVMRRYGDGNDIVWIKGPPRCSTHVMGAFSDGDKVYVDMEQAIANIFPFMPNADGSPWDPTTAIPTITRISADLSGKTPTSYKTEPLFSQYKGALPRQDDRYNTMPYRYGFLPTTNPATGPYRRGNAAYVTMDHQTGTARLYDAGLNTRLNEACFAPRRDDAPEGDGYLMGVAHRLEEKRADLIILDAQRPDEGPAAIVHMPTDIVGQIHGLWVPDSKIPAA